MGTYMWALYAREVKRFQKLFLDTIFSPIVSMALYLAIFGIVLGNRVVDGTPYLTFIYTGLLGMNLVNNSFSNPGFALIISKNLGTIIDLQLAPIKPWKIGISYALAAATRGLITMIIAALFTAWFIPGMRIDHPFQLVIVLFLTGFQYGMLGVIFGMWARNFESLTFITTFILQPMIFLAGVFYPVATLPYPWSVVSMFNPIHHNINLFRNAFISYSDASIMNSWLIVGAFAVILFVIMYFSTERNIKKSY